MYLVNIEYLYFRQLHACNLKKNGFCRWKKQRIFQHRMSSRKYCCPTFLTLCSKKLTSPISIYTVCLMLLWLTFCFCCGPRIKFFFGTKIEQAKYAVFKFSLSEKLSLMSKRLIAKIDRMWQSIWSLAICNTWRTDKNSRRSFVGGLPVILFNHIWFQSV